MKKLKREIWLYLMSFFTDEIYKISLKSYIKGVCKDSHKDEEDFDTWFLKTLNEIKL